MLSVEGRGVNASVLEKDIGTMNGVIHVIDRQATRQSISLLEGQCHEIFCFRFFLQITFPQAPENNIRVISIFFENSRRSPRIFEKKLKWP
jgi:hypothetical protein